MITYQDIINDLEDLQRAEAAIDARIQEIYAAAPAPAGVAPAMAAAGAAAAPAVAPAHLNSLLAAQAAKAKHQQWINQIAGKVFGYARESGGTAKSILKNRDVDFVHADLSVSGAAPYAKAVQYKSTLQDSDAQVDYMMAEAANQVSGERGEVPLADQRKAIDVKVQSLGNPWPFRYQDFPYEIAAGLGSINEFGLTYASAIEEAQNRVLANLTTYRQHVRGGLPGHGLSPAAQAGLYHHNPPPPAGGAAAAAAAAGGAPAVPGAPIVPGAAAAGHPAPPAQGRASSDIPFMQHPPNAGPRSTALEPLAGGGVASVLTVKVHFADTRIYYYGTQQVQINRMHFACYLENGNFYVKYIMNPHG